MSTRRKIALPLLIACAGTFIGCATTPAPKKEAELDANGKPIEYVWVTPTGSHIAVKVPKDQAQTSQLQSDREKQSIQNVMNRGTKQDKPPGAN